LEIQFNMSDLILIVDDEEDLREVVRALLELNGFRVIEAENANEMFSQVKENDISLILLDIGLPENDGLSALKKMRPDSDIPIVLLTGKGDVIDKVVGLELGADDYITKPFHSHELIARVKNVLRRASAPKSPEAKNNNTGAVITFNGWKLNVNSQILINPNDEEIFITGHEFAILQALINDAGRTLSRDRLLDKVSTNDREHTPFDRSLDVMIAKLRKKLDDNPKMPKFIRTIRQVGYMFIAEISN